MKLYRLEKHFDNWILEEGYIIFEPGKYSFDDLDEDEYAEDDRVGEEVDITNLYEGAFIYFDEYGDYHLIDDIPLNKANEAAFLALNTEDFNLQRMAYSLLEEYLVNPKIIAKEDEEEYVRTRKE